MEFLIILLLLGALVFSCLTFVEVEHMNDNLLDLEHYLRRKRNRKKR